MAQIRVHLDLGDTEPGRAGLDDYVAAHVTIRDTSLADIEHPAVAAVSTSPTAIGGDLTVEVPDGALVAGRRYSLFAHLDRVGDGSIRAGDMITTDDVPVRPGDVDAAEPVRAVLRRI